MVKGQPGAKLSNTADVLVPYSWLRHTVEDPAT